jgi:hypothetical protein
MSQNVVTTRSASKVSSPNPPSPSDPPKTTPNAQKTTEKTSQQSVPSAPSSKLEYDFLKDLKRTKENISLFELMKIPRIQNNFIKTLQGNTMKNINQVNVGKRKETRKTSLSNENPTP